MDTVLALLPKTIQACYTTMLLQQTREDKPTADFQTLHFLLFEFPKIFEKESALRGLQLAMCTIRCHYILHIRPLIQSDVRKHWIAWLPCGNYIFIFTRHGQWPADQTLRLESAKSESAGQI